MIFPRHKKKAKKRKKKEKLTPTEESILIRLYGTNRLRNIFLFVRLFFSASWAFGQLYSFRGPAALLIVPLELLLSTH